MKEHLMSKLPFLLQSLIKAAVCMVYSEAIQHKLIKTMGSEVKFI
jgi:biotin transporter BioY